MTQKSVWFFDEVDLFEILCPHKYAAYKELHPLQCYNKMDFLFMENQALNQLYLIAEGKIKVGYYDEAGKEYVKAILGSGELLGEKGFLGAKRWKEFAEVIEDNTYVCKMDLETAQALARDYKPFSLTIQKKIGDRMQQLERRLEILLFKDVKQRLKEFIKDLAEEKGTHKEGGIYIQHELTQSEIAALIGTSRKSVSLLMNELEDEMAIKFSRKEIIVPKASALLG